MAKSFDLIVLGSGTRGLWLSAQAVKMGWSVLWVEIEQPRQSHDKFEFDEWPFQVGSAERRSEVNAEFNDFIQSVFQPKLQELAVQILTPDGPLELSGLVFKSSLNKFFGNNDRKLLEYLKSIQDGCGKKLDAHTRHIQELYLAHRWCLEWLASLRITREVSTLNWILDWSGTALDPSVGYWLSQDSSAQIADRAVAWAEKNGVKVKRGAKVADVSMQDGLAAGVEILGSEGFIRSRFVVVSCSSETLQKKLPTVGQKVRAPDFSSRIRWIWGRCGIRLKSGARPSGLMDFSSFVTDPLLPLSEANCGLVHWKSQDAEEHVTCWIRMAAADVKRKSYLTQMTTEVVNRLSTLFPRLNESIKEILSFEEYFEPIDIAADKFPIVFEKSCPFVSSKSRVRNVYFAMPELDMDLDYTAGLKNERNGLEFLRSIRNKELRSDRKIHSSRDGRDMVATK